MAKLLQPFSQKFKFPIPLKKYSTTIKRSELYKNCYAILGVDEFADQNTVRRAYLELVKKFHPDSGKPEASQEKFKEIDNAFKVLQAKFAKNRRGIQEDDEEKVYDIRHTAPQHRQYLSYDGLGFGTMFQRQKQHDQIKAMKAQERVLNHRIEKAQAGEMSLMKKDGSFYKKHAIKTKYGFDRVVEDLIQEAMSKGDFDNLSCSGKPLSTAQTQNPYLDFTTAKLNKILLENGFTPEWITLQREIREEITELKEKLENHRQYFGEVPLNDNEFFNWQLILDKYTDSETKINKKIDKLNLIVPLMDNQLCRIRVKRLGDMILNDPAIPRNKGKPVEASNTDNKPKEEKSFLSIIFNFLS